MTNELAVILTSKDFTLLENLVHNWDEPFPGASEHIRRKLASATVVFPDDVPSNIVTLNSRVRFSVGTAVPEEWTVVDGPGDALSQLILPLASSRGLALIGGAVGQAVEALQPDGTTEILLIEALPYQSRQTRPLVGLRVVSRRAFPDARSMLSAGRTRSSTSSMGKDDDPGPSAA